MRIRQFLLVSAAALSVSACSSLGIDMGKGAAAPTNASLNSGGALQTNDQSGAPPVRVDQALDTSYGNYLNARLAASQHDMDNAAKFYRASLDADPNNPELLARAFLYSVSAGDMERRRSWRRKSSSTSRTIAPRALTLAVEAYQAERLRRRARPAFEIRSGAICGADHRIARRVVRRRRRQNRHGTCRLDVAQGAGRHGFACRVSPRPGVRSGGSPNRGRCCLSRSVEG